MAVAIVQNYAIHALLTTGFMTPTVINMAAQVSGRLPAFPVIHNMGVQVAIQDRSYNPNSETLK